MERNERIIALADQIKTGWEMCGSPLRMCEKEVITLQTLCACKLNLKEHGEAFSFNGIKEGGIGRGADNGPAFREMVQDGYLETGVFQGRPTIIPTDKLLDLVEAHFAKD